MVEGTGEGGPDEALILHCFVVQGHLSDRAVNVLVSKMEVSSSGCALVTQLQKWMDSFFSS